VLVALLVSVAHAETVTASWTNATTNTDSTAIPSSGPGSLVRTVVEYGTRNGSTFGTKAGEVFVAAPATTLSLNLVVVQEYALRAFHCNTYATTFALGAAGCSAASNVVFRTVQPPTPGVPQNLTVSSPIVYEIRPNTSGQLVASRMGLAPVGALCGAEFQIVDGVRYHSVQASDADLVNWPQAPASLRLWARCA
jgi:hypothetical protein